MTKKAYPIHDLYIRELKTTTVEGKTSLPLLSFDDHLLRRFGFAEHVSIESGYKNEMKVREVADEIWVCIEGKVLLSWRDLREGSPSEGIQFKLTIKEPSLLLVPFGVAFGIQTLDEPAQLIRFSTHSEGFHEGDRMISREKN